MVNAETVKSKPNGNDSGFIIYSNIIDFSGILLDNSGYLITQCNFFERIGCLVVKK